MAAGSGCNAAANRCENVNVIGVPLVKAPGTLTRSVAAPAKDQRSVLMKGVGRQLHPRIPSLRQPLYRRHQPRSPPRPVPIASRVLTRSEPRKPPATAGHNLRRILRRVLRYRIHAPPATRNQADVARARRATPSISACRSVGPARADDAYIAAAQPSQPRRNVPGSIRRFGRTPSYRSALRLQRVVSDRRDLGSPLRSGDRSAFHLGRDI
jgi:hypothetical protein